MCNATPPAAPRRIEHGVYQRTAGRVPQASRTEQPEGGVQRSEWCQKQSVTSQGFLYILRFFCKSRQNREPTSGLEPLTCSLRVIGHALRGCAGDCKSRIFEGSSLLRLAQSCSILRSRWCQSGINCALAAAARASSRSPWFHDPSPATQINSALAGAYHTLGRRGEPHRHDRVVCRVHLQLAERPKR